MTLTFATSLSEVAQGVVTAFGIGGTGWAIARWLNRPRFIVGVPPSSAEQRTKGMRPWDVGRPSITQGFSHHSRCFAYRVWRRRKTQLSRRDVEKCSDPLRLRWVREGTDGCIRFSVLFANRGHRVALQPMLSIILHGERAYYRLRLLDVQTESLECKVYTSDPNRLLDAELRKRSSPEPIMKAYADYMQDIDNHGDGVYLWGEIMESGSYELVHLVLEADSDVDSFYLILTVAGTDSWMRDATYVQRCDIQRESEHAARIGCAERA